MPFEAVTLRFISGGVWEDVVKDERNDWPESVVAEIVALSLSERSALRGQDMGAHVRLARSGIRLAEQLYRSGSEGRAALERLMSHEEPIVRLLAATWVLEFNPQIAVPVLEHLVLWSRQMPEKKGNFDVMIIGNQAEAALEDRRSADADGSSRLE